MRKVLKLSKFLKWWCAIAHRYMETIYHVQNPKGATYPLKKFLDVENSVISGRKHKVKVFENFSRSDGLSKFYKLERSTFKTDSKKNQLDWLHIDDFIRKTLCQSSGFGLCKNFRIENIQRHLST
jgi:hypothetical protein